LARRAGRAALALVLCACTAIAFGQEVPPPAYQLAAQQAGVPSPVLYAVALQESGARLRGRLIPWPWTLNVAGRAERYATRAEACAGIRRALARTPANRIDVGLGQGPVVVVINSRDVVGAGQRLGAFGRTTADGHQLRIPRGTERRCDPIVSDVAGADQQPADRFAAGLEFMPG